MGTQSQTKHPSTADVLAAFGVSTASEIDATLRTALGECFGFLPRGETKYFPEEGELAVRKLGIGPGDRIPLEVRSVIGETLGFKEPPLPVWVRAGEWAVGPDWGWSVAVRIKSVDSGMVTLSRGDPMPAGVFLLEHSHLPRLKCIETTCACVCDDTDPVPEEKIMVNGNIVVRCHACHHAHDPAVFSVWESALKRHR